MFVVCALEWFARLFCGCRCVCCAVAALFFLFFLCFFLFVLCCRKYEITASGEYHTECIVQLQSATPSLRVTLALHLFAAPYAYPPNTTEPFRVIGSHTRLLRLVAAEQQFRVALDLHLRQGESLACVVSVLPHIQQSALQPPIQLVTSTQSSSFFQLLLTMADFFG